MTHATSKNDARMQGEPCLILVHRDESHACIRKKRVEIRDRLQTVTGKPSGQDGTDLEIRGDRHSTRIRRLGGHARSNCVGARLIAQNGDDCGRIDDDHSPQPASHSALVTGRMS